MGQRTYAANDPTLYTDHTGLDFWNDLARNALAFGAGVLNGATFGLSGMIMSAVVPGYNCFVEANSGFYTAGDIVGMVGSAVVATVMTAGAGGVVVGGVVAARLTVAAGARVTAVSVRTTATTAVRTSSATSVLRAGSSCVVNSFAPGTLVLMADGSTEPIELIDIGDKVWAADPETGEAGAHAVTALIEGSGVKDLVTVSTQSRSVVATAGHPFWSVSDTAWVDAGDLAVGDAVLEADGATSVITQVVEASRPAVVHNLTVAELHTYFVLVGDSPTLVHNCSASSVRLGNNLVQSGVTRPAESAAHHIVAGGAARADASRKILQSFNIGIDDAANGVFLTRNLSSANPNGASVHSTIHTNVYYDTVEGLLRGATNRDQALGVLDFLRSSLLAGGSL